MLTWRQDSLGHGQGCPLICTADLLEWLKVELLRGARRRRHVTGPNWRGRLRHGGPHHCGAARWPGHPLHPAVTPTMHQGQNVLSVSKGTAHLSHQQTCRALTPALQPFDSINAYRVGTCTGPNSVWRCMVSIAASRRAASQLNEQQRSVQRVSLAHDCKTT